MAEQVLIQFRADKALKQEVAETYETLLANPYPVPRKSLLPPVLMLYLHEIESKLDLP